MISIDLDKVPINITEHILNFREFLNISWGHVINKVMHDHDWDDDGYFIDDWMQVNWEFLVERELLGKKHSLTQFSTTHLPKNLIHHNKDPDYVVLAEFSKNLVDIKTNTTLSKNKILRFFTFNTLYDKSKSLTYGPPFEVVGLVNDKTKELHYVKIEDLEFYLYDFNQYEYKEYYLDYVS